MPYPHDAGFVSRVRVGDFVDYGSFNQRGSAQADSSRYRISLMHYRQSLCAGDKITLGGGDGFSGTCLVVRWRRTIATFGTAGLTSADGLGASFITTAAFARISSIRARIRDLSACPQAVLFR